MALSERKVLTSVEILVDRKAVNVAWEHQVLRDAEIIISTPHRGAFPLDDNGEVDETIKGQMGTSISQLLGKAGSDAQKKVTKVQDDNAELQQKLDNATQSLATAASDKEKLETQVIALADALDQAVGDKSALQKTIDQLTAEKAELEKQLRAKPQMEETTNAEPAEVVKAE